MTDAALAKWLREELPGMRRTMGLHAPHGWHTSLDALTALLALQDYTIAALEAWALDVEPAPPYERSPEENGLMATLDRLRAIGAAHE